MIRYHSTKLMTRRWTMVVFFNLVDISPMNAIIIWVKLKTYVQCRRGVRCVLLITLAKTIAGITTNYNPSVQRPVSPHSCLASENMNKRRTCYCFLRKRTGNLRYTAKTVNREFLVNTASLFAFST